MLARLSLALACMNKVFSANVSLSVFIGLYILLSFAER